MIQRERSAIRPEKLLLPKRSNFSAGVRSEPPVDSIEKIEKLQDLEEIISMMTAAFKQYFRESTTK